MAVEIIHDTDKEVACMFCNTSDNVFGRIFVAQKGWDAGEIAEAFLRFCRVHRGDIRMLADVWDELYSLFESEALADDAVMQHLLE